DVADPEDGREKPLLQDTHVQASCDIFRRRRYPGTECQPASAEIHRDLAGSCGRVGATRDVELLAHCLQERFGTEWHDVFHDSVVRQNVHLIVWKGHAKKRRVVHAINGGAVRDRTTPDVMPHARRAGGAVMAVGNLEGRNRRKRGDHAVAGVAGQPPDRVPNAVRRLEIEQRLSLGGGRRDLVNDSYRTVDEKHGTALGTESDHVSSTIILLVATSTFVLPDRAAVVFVE